MKKEGVIHLIPLVILAVFGVAASVVWIKNNPQIIKDIPQGLTKFIISPTPTNTPTPSSTPTPTVTPTNTPVPTRTPSPTPLYSPTPKPPSVPVSSTPPGAGYSRQSVQIDSGVFTVSIVAADIGSTKVVVDTASTSDCFNDCPTLPLATYVSRRGAYAGIHGAYACPAEYASCAGKTNSFDLLIMNIDKYYFNSANNVYSSNPAVIFGAGYIRFVRHASEWGRDTGVDGVLSNFPLLVFGNSLTYSEPGDAKMSSRSSRGFVANKGNTVYIGVVHSATVAESAKIMMAMGMENAMNLDGGGSTALWHGGYKLGPGRNLTNAILFLTR